MSLDYNLKNVANRDSLFYPDTEEYGRHRDMMKGEVVSVIHYMIPLGIPVLKDEGTVAQFYRRYVMWCAVMGWGREEFMTIELLRSLIGLSTNVSPKTDAAFRKFCAGKMEEMAERETVKAVTADREKNAVVAGPHGLAAG